ncbi:MAG: hypothetical protein ACK4UP_05495 [Spirosomataceae bacterium]
MINVGERIDELLRVKNIPKKDLMEFLNITRQGLYHKMKTNTFKSDELEQLATFFEMDLDNFLKFENQSKEDSKADIMFKKILEELKILHNQLSMKDQQINKLLDILGKLDPMSDSAKVLNLNAEFKQTA